MRRGACAPAGLRTTGAKLKHSAVSNTVDLFRSIDIQYLQCVEKLVCRLLKRSQMEGRAKFDEAYAWYVEASRTSATKHMSLFSSLLAIAREQRKIKHLLRVEIRRNRSLLS
jgi:hypothetical protein